MLFDLPRHESVLPPELQVDALVGKTTGRISEKIDKHVHRVADAKVEAWLRAAARSLEQAAVRRNKVLHSRPATIEGAQRLHHWRPGHTETSTITLDDLLDAINVVEQARAALGPLRVW